MDSDITPVRSSERVRTVAKLLVSRRQSLEVLRPILVERGAIMGAIWNAWWEAGALTSLPFYPDDFPRLVVAHLIGMIDWSNPVGGTAPVPQDIGDGLRELIAVSSQTRVREPQRGEEAALLAFRASLGLQARTQARRCGETLTEWADNLTYRVARHNLACDRAGSHMNSRGHCLGDLLSAAVVPRGSRKRCDNLTRRIGTSIEAWRIA